MKQLLTATLLLFSLHCFSQTDLLVLKRRNQIIQTWVPGSIIHFQFSSKQWIQGIIKEVKNDSLLVDQINIVQVGNAFGYPTIDTAHMGLMRLHVREIYGMPKRDAAGIFTNGALFQLGGGAYILLNVANTLIKNDPLFSAANATRLGIASGIFLIGTIMASAHKTYIVLGKKYTMTTIHTR